MKYKTISKKADVPAFEGIEIEFVKTDNDVTAVEIKQGDKVLRITKKGEYTSNLAVSIVAPPKTKDVWTVSVETVDGLKVEKHFDDEDAARNALYDYERKYEIEWSAILQNTVFVEDEDI